MGTEAMTETRRLIDDYVAHGSEEAFRELVSRYVDLVHSTAMRMVGGDAHLAQDVTQTVFIDLARSARGLPREVSLGGWLHRHTWFKALNALRAERRRQSRERQAVEMNSVHDSPDSGLAELRPVLDEAINRLGAEDRQAIVLRYFERRDFRAIGLVLGTTEDAAQKRVSRALQKLHGWLTRRGSTTSLSALGGLLTAEAVQGAPAGLAASVANAALAAAPAGGGLTLAALKLMASTKLRSAGITLLVGASLVTPFLLQRTANSRLKALHELSLAQGAERAALARLNQRLEASLGRVVSATPLPEGLFSELLRLRGEVGRLRDGRRALAARAREGDTAGTDLLATLEREWSARTLQLKQWVDAHPEARIPELALLDDHDWANAIYPFTLENEEECRRAISNVRANAELRVLDGLVGALRRRSADGRTGPPADISELAPYVAPPVVPSWLTRYQVVRSDTLIPELQGGDEWVVTQKSPVDAEWDMRTSVGLHGGGSADCRVKHRWGTPP